MRGTGTVRSGRRRWPAILLLLALVTPPGCGEQPAEEPAAESPAPGAEAAPELTADEKLAEEVRRAMLQAPALAREEIQIAVVQAQVFLTGQVSAPHLRDEAVAVAGQVPGVEGVQSKINVRRPRPAAGTGP